uniref:Uncharacterized protein n=1 Tax=Panagrolaimus sp. PS1159 TaxID=55785 RepID=A0AC35FLG5_9BILA
QQQQQLYRTNHLQQQQQQLPQIREIREIPIQAAAQMIDPTQLIRIPAAAALREKMAEIFAVEEIGTVPLPRLMELRRHIQAIHNIDYFFEAIPMNHLNHISVNIIETILHLIDDVDEVNELILKHVKNYLNFLFMCGNRSARFRRTFEKHSALHWLGMLRFDAIRADVIYSLHLFTSNISILYTDENFMHFLSDIITNYQSFPDTSDQKGYICIFIAKLLQHYPYFFHRSYTSLNRNVFNELLTIVEKIVKNKYDDERKPPMLGSAVKFIIKFFDISIDDFREERVDWHAHVSRFVHLMDIMSFIIRNVKSYRIFFDKPALMHNVCAIQDLLLAGDEINRCHRSGRRVEIPLNRNSGNRRSRNGEENNTDDNIRVVTTCGSAAINEIEGNGGGGGGGVVRSKTMPTDGPPDRKYARKTIEQDTIENIPPVSSIILFPLPSVEILDMNLSTTFRTRESFLNLYRQRKISAFYILNLKRATLRLLGSLCIASSSNKDIAAEHEVVENVFKLARAGDSVKVDYVALVKRALTEICTDHEKNLQALNDIEQHPSHLISKKDVIDTIYSNTHNGTNR